METNRLPSLDFFRGLWVAFLILVMAVADLPTVYSHLRLSHWHGLSAADLIFPAFLFSMGLSMWFCFEKFGRKMSVAAVRRVLRRVAILAVLSLLLEFLLENLIFDWNVAHVAGYHTTVFLKNDNSPILARLAICYGIGAVVCLNFSKRNLMYLAAALLVGYHFLLQSSGNLDPENNRFAPFNFSNLETWATLLPMLASLILGWLAGNLLDFRQEKEGLLVRDLIFYGIVCTVFGLAWDLFLPVNWKLWTSSFVLVGGGVSMLVFAACVYLVDGLGFRNGAGFFRAFGLNSLFAYLFALLVLKFLGMPQGGSMSSFQIFIFEKFFAPLGLPAFDSLVFGLFFVLICWLVCRFLMVRKIFFSV